MGFAIFFLLLLCTEQGKKKLETHLGASILFREGDRVWPA
jgi:hypothetical protein